VLFALGLGGTFLTGLYTFRLYFIVFHGEPTPFAREHFHRTRGREGPLTMIVPVSVLAVLAVIGGWIQFAPFWHPIANWLNPVAEPLVEPTGWMELVASIAAVGLGLAGIWLAWAIYAAGRVRVPGLAFVRRTLEHKLWFDELYDALFYTPAVAITHELYALVERPLIAGSLDAIGIGSREAWSGTSRIQTGLVRMYVLMLASALTVMVVVFLAVR
jgi:NADH-quinone oxidoreductase subunit L